ncbi:phosphatidylinositol N-acetylglucosaminyltransferase subunit A [Nematocida minor]|uniref:phosphatidylinositol N-acetylglucosaminyltransferase subunit A n=1 Tax=Nematocida minor TaxID=1912983 RepID=UPI00221EBE3F|nr:phosphatidylinositol N-acetylglucosaminyltransferase subunit A [Nematocida minor]KAI5190678.1 phosphatidylinositol N-acetylglucosaminyltransferase subunit A [Nematocida minor]
MRVAMMSDFFYPRLGGVENHILNLSKELKKLGHTVIIITNANTGVSGVRYVDGFKVYYLELFTLFGGSVFPTVLCSSMPIVELLLAEEIEIVHGHQCSTMAIEGIFHSRLLGIPTCFTNHSLVKIESLGGVVTSSTFRMSIRESKGIICVSGATRDNTADRLGIDGYNIRVIPNAVTEEFKPSNEPLEWIPSDEAAENNEVKRLNSDGMMKGRKSGSSLIKDGGVDGSTDGSIKSRVVENEKIDENVRTTAGTTNLRNESVIVEDNEVNSATTESVRGAEDLIIISVVSRLTARRGAGLLADVLPSICRMDDRIRIVIAGDGEKKELLEQTVEKYHLKGRVKFLGGVHPSEVKNILNRSNLFLNTSLTDAFCISIIEASACGLYVVSTDVDGISEVLPGDMITLVPPTAEGIVSGIKASIPKISAYNRKLSHARVHSMYKWSLVAKETDTVYRDIFRESAKASLRDRLKLSIKRIYRTEKDRLSFLFKFLLVINYAIIFISAVQYENKRRHRQ